MDKVVRCAEAFDIGLICSMFWYDTGLTDYCDEPRNTGWGDENSKTRGVRLKAHELRFSHRE